MKSEKHKRYSFPCWNCGEEVDLEALGESCPECGASLTSADYDATAMPLLMTMNQTKQEMLDARSNFEKYHNRYVRFQSDHAFLGKILRTFMLKRREALLVEARAKAACYKNKKRAVEKHAEARYYASKWFKEKNIFLASTTSKESLLTCATYSEDAKHVVKEKQNKKGRGCFGEYRTFDILSSAIEEGGIYPASLVSHLYVPPPHGIKQSLNSSPFTEIDLTLITQKAIYVIEAKNLHGRVTCSYRRKQHKYHVYIEQGRNDRVLASIPRFEDPGVKQNERHRQALIERIGCQPTKVFNIVTYLNNLGFTPPKIQGVNNVFITTLEGKQPSFGGYDLLEVIKRIEDSLPNAFSEYEVEMLGAELKKRFSDEDGSKETLHLNHSKKLSLYNLNPARHSRLC